MEGVYAIFGTPVAGSLSPKIHRLFGQQFGLQIEYAPIETQPFALEQNLRAFVARGGRGANITSPHKVKICSYLDTVSKIAKHIGSVNTISVLQDGSIHGDNTDGLGFITDLKNKGIYPQNKSVLILGNGGAAKAIRFALSSLNPASIETVTRPNYACLEGMHFDIVINATSAGLHGLKPPLPQGFCMEDSTCYDLNYGSSSTPFLEYARTKGAKEAIDGWGMLLEQAAESFYLWHKLTPNTVQISGDDVL